MWVLWELGWLIEGEGSVRMVRCLDGVLGRRWTTEDTERGKEERKETLFYSSKVKVMRLPLLVGPLGYERGNSMGLILDASSCFPFIFFFFTESVV